MKKKTLNIVGCGRVGQTLGRLLHTMSDCEIQDIAGGELERTSQAAGFIGTGRPVDSLAEMRPADLWMLSVPDTRITTVAGDLASLAHASLLEATVANVLRLGPGALTGPAARGDMKVVHEQGAAVSGWQPDAGVVYQELSRLARSLALHRSPFACAPADQRKAAKTRSTITPDCPR